MQNAMPKAMQNAVHTYFANCNTIKSRGGGSMTFQIKPNKKETDNKTIRFPSCLVKRINEVVEKNQSNFSEFVIQACEYALEHMEENET